MRRPPPIARFIAQPIALILIAATSGCTSDPKFTQHRSYPSQLSRLSPSTIQLFRADTRVTLTNTTAKNFGPSTIWLNQWYAHDIDGLGIGQTITLNLNSFKDEYGDAFRGGGFFATQAPDKIVLAELETHPTDQLAEAAPALLPLIVVGQREH